MSQQEIICFDLLNVTQLLEALINSHYDLDDNLTTEDLITILTVIQLMQQHAEAQTLRIHSNKDLVCATQSKHTDN